MTSVKKYTNESVLRSLLKSFSWRIIAITDTILTVFIVTCVLGDCGVKNALTIGVLEFSIKFVSYYIHERIWLTIQFKKRFGVTRTLFKTLSWRVIATVITFIVAGEILNSQDNAALYIAGIEIFTKSLLYYMHERIWLILPLGKLDQLLRTLSMQKNIVKHSYSVNRDSRKKLKQHKSILLWFTGLSGSGKSTIANCVEQELHKNSIHTYTLDGDNIRKGLNSDLSFSPEDRSENIRRIAETARLMIDAGLVVLAAFVSPYRKDRDHIRKIVGDDNMVEIFINTSIEECERRDVKGLYKKARKGEIKNMTGISAPYESPLHPDIQINTEEVTIVDATKQIINFINPKLILQNE